MTHAEIFRSAFKNESPGTNFITPTFMRYGKSGSFVYELSRGDAFLSKGYMYGVTVVRISPRERAYNLSSSFGSLEKAELYIQALDVADRAQGRANAEEKPITVYWKNTLDFHSTSEPAMIGSNDTEIITLEPA